MLFSLSFPTFFLTATWKLCSFWPTHPAPVVHLYICTPFLAALFPIFHSSVYILADFTSVAHKPASFLYLRCITAWEDWPCSLGSHRCGLLLHAVQPCLKSPPRSAFLQPAFAFSSHAEQTQLPLHAHVCMYLYTHPSPQKETNFARFNALRVLLWTLPLLLQLWF